MTRRALRFAAVVLAGAAVLLRVEERIKQGRKAEAIRRIKAQPFYRERGRVVDIG